MGKRVGGVSGQTDPSSNLDPKLQEKMLTGQSKESQEQTDESSSTEPKKKYDPLLSAARNKLQRESEVLADATGTSRDSAIADKSVEDLLTDPTALTQDQADQTRVAPTLTDSFFSGDEWYNADRRRDAAWLYQAEKHDAKRDDGGFINRITRAADFVLDGFVLPGVSPANLTTEMKRDFGLVDQQAQRTNYNPMVQRGVAEAMAKERAQDPTKKNKGSLVSAAAASGAVEVNKSGQQVPNRNFLMTGLAMVEHAFADWSYLSAEATNSIDEFGGTLDRKAARRKRELIELGTDITKARGNYALGQKIHQEYQRNSGQEVTKISQADATILGDMFKELYYEFNGERINPTVDDKGNPIKSPKRKGTVAQYPSWFEKAKAESEQKQKPLALLVRDQQENGETIFTLTDYGKRKLMQGRKQRELTFNKEIIKPLTAPLDDTAAMESTSELLQRSRGQMAGDKRNFTKRVLGKIRNLFVGKQLDNALTNASSMPHAVDDNRLKIGMGMFLNSILSKQEDILTNPAISWQAEGVGLGRTKTFEYQTEERLDQRDVSEAQFKYDRVLDEWFAQRPNRDRNNEQDMIIAMQENPKPIELRDPYRAADIVRQQRRKLAQELHASVEGRNKANYLTYSTLGFNQRILPQQTYFNYVTSKFVRAVTRAVTPDFMRNSIDERALRQMYASHLLPKSLTKSNVSTDKMLPDTREIQLINHERTLNAWGERLTELNTFDDQSFNQLSQLINDKTPIAEIQQQFPELVAAAQNNLKLDPNNDLDAQLLEAIMDQGQEAISFIDGLMDFSKYYKAKGSKAGLGLDYTKGKQFSTYFNFHIDGMTNGTASNGLQMGDIPTALRTGVLRVGHKDLLDEGDVRDILMRDAPKVIDEDPFVLKMENDDNVEEATDHVTRIARDVFGNKQLHKDTTMTYGYGKELESFWVNFVNALELQYTRYEFEVANADSLGISKEDVVLKQQYIDSMNWISSVNEDGKFAFKLKVDGQDVAGIDAAAKIINQKYKSPLTKVMSDDGIKSRALMRGTAAMYAAMDERWTMEGPTQMLEFGKDVSMGYDEATLSKYNIYRPDLAPAVKRGALSRTSPIYDVRSTAAAVRVKDGKKRPGDWAWGGSLPGPIQAIDAAVVARTLTGRSFEKIKQANKGNPYVATIYDAFKGTANNYWAVLEEANNNWVLANKEFSYLQSAKKALSKTKTIWDNEINQRIKQNPNEIVGATESVYMNYVLEYDSGKQEFSNLKSLINSLYVKNGYNRADPKSRKAGYDTVVNEFIDNLNSVGYVMGATRKANRDGEILPPSVNVRQLKVFVDTFYDMLGEQVTKDGRTTNSSFLDRVGTMATKADKQRSLLFDLIKSNPKPGERDQRRGFRTPSGMRIALQYFGA